MDTSQSQFPKQIVWAVVALSVLPILLMFTFSMLRYPFQFEPTPIGLLNVPGAVLHTLLEWSAICIALCTVAFAFSHFTVKHDMISPVIGTALFFSAMIDAFQVLAVDGLILLVRDKNDFVAISWALSRTFYICLLIAGTAPFIKRPTPTGSFITVRGTRFMLLTGILFVAMAYAIIYILARVPDLPSPYWPDFPIPRPWDLLPLILFLIAGGIVFPRFDKFNPSLFGKGLIVSVAPNVAAQMHMAYGSKQVYDENFYIALYLKIIAYLVPLIGLMIDYTRAYRVEVTLRTTEEKLRVARRVQQGLLPKLAPDLPGFDVAGRSYPAEVVGGDYYDFIPMLNGHLGIVVADVSGHEIGASILMAQTRAYLRALSLSHESIVSMISQVNRFLSRDVQDRWFVTLFYVSLDCQNATIEYAAAGHECYLFNGDGSPHKLESTSPPLGVVDDRNVACGPTTKMDPGSVLLLMTDGLIEMSNPAGQHFGLERVFAVVRENQNRSAIDIVDALYSTAETFRGSSRREDDVTVVVVKRERG